MKSVLFLLFFIGCIAPLAASNVAELLRKGDRLDEQHRSAEALEFYLEANNLRPGDTEILRRIAKQYSQMSSDPAPRGRQKELAAMGLQYALLAVEADPNNAEARLALAICYGRAAFYESPSRKMEYSRFVREEAQRAAKLDSSLDYAWHVLARWHYEISTLNPAVRGIAQMIYGQFPDASLEQAAEYFQRAIRVGPPRVVHHIELGRTYAALGRSEDARREIETGLSLPSREKDDEETKERGRRLLNRLSSWDRHHLQQYPSVGRHQNA
jgi:tetratricopeptide (TPR) repeat protein